MTGRAHSGGRPHMGCVISPHGLETSDESSLGGYLKFVGPGWAVSPAVGPITIIDHHAVAAALFYPDESTR